MKNNKIKILYEDGDILALSKPVNIHCRSTGNPDNTTVMELFPQLKMAHRLDSKTSGVLIGGKNSRAAALLIEQFRKREIQKIYIAFSSQKITSQAENMWKNKLVKARKGRMKISNHGGLTAITFAAMFPVKNGTLLFLKPLTGRTHQLRVQTLHHGLPILGDTLYAKKFPHPRMMLHSFYLSFFHPLKLKRIEVFDPLPEDFFRVFSQSTFEQNFFVFKKRIKELSSHF